MEDLVDHFLDTIGLAGVAGLGALLLPSALDRRSKGIFLGLAGIVLAVGLLAMLAWVLFPKAHRLPFKVRRRLVSLRQAIREARKKKPVVASFSDYAASGGYYLASAADSIVALPATLTGSIGVFAVRPALHGLFQRFDVNTAVLDRAPHAEINLMSPELSPDTRDWLQADVEDTYRRFLSRVLAA